MNTTLTTTGRPTHPPQPDERQALVTRRVGVVDRAALHLGMALIRWGRRPVAGLERRATRVERALALHELEEHLRQQPAAALWAVHQSHLR